MNAEKVDVVIIGAGWFGLAAAKTYIQVEPNANIVVLDANPSIGGTWSKELLYDGLRSNNLYGTIEYPDFPMDGLNITAEKGKYLDGHVVLEYLQLYADKFDVTRRIRFNTKVVSAERLGDIDAWRTTTEAGITIDSKKLIVATGLTSVPSIPSIVGLGSFGAPVIHTKNFHDGLPQLKKEGKTVAVLGGNKSAYDAVYLLASSGVKVKWIIRQSGRGPGWMSPSYVTPFKLWVEKLVTTRFLTWFSPSVWGEADGHPWARRFLHGTSVGRWISDRFWDVLTKDLEDLNGYDRHERTKVLHPWFGSFWAGSGLSILNYPSSIYDFIKDGTVDVHISDIDHASSRTIHLSSGVDIADLDGLVLCTGWQYMPPIKFLPEGIDKDLGIPYSAPTSIDPEAVTDPIVEKADREILARFPRLVDQPVINPDSVVFKEKGRDANHPFRLYRYIAPPTLKFGRSIAFSGMYHSINTCQAAEIHALWSVAYLTDRMNLDKKTPEERANSTTTLEEDLSWDATLAARWSKWRTPGGDGALFPDLVFDNLSYFDALVQDLGLQSRRKSGYVKDCFVPHGPEDWRGLTQEWLAKVKAGEPSGRVY